MKLVDEIEAAAKSCSIVEEDDDVMAAYAITTSNYWPRIKAALLAAEEMERYARVTRGAFSLHESADRFRAATEGTK